MTLRSEASSIVRRIFIAVAFLAAAFGASGQQAEPLLSQYYEMPAFYNPGAIGRYDFINIRAGARLQWVGIDRAPVSIVGTADMPFKLGNKRLAVGLALQQESYGLYRNTTLGVMAGYTFKLFGGTLTPGLRIGLLNQTFRGSEVYIPDGDDFHTPGDDALPTSDVGGNAFDIGAGLHYARRGFWAGVGLLHANAPTVRFSTDGTGSGGTMSGSRDGDDGSSSAGDDGGSTSSDVKNYEFPVDRSLYFMAGGNISIKNTLFELMPSIIVGSDFSDINGIATARLRYNKLITAGASYRYRDGIAIHLALELKNFYVGYTYEYPLSAISRASSGSHELIAGYALKLDLGEKNRNKQKSIRIL